MSTATTTIDLPAEREEPGLFAHFFGSIYHYREYLLQSVARDLRVKYKRSTLGYLWSMLNPLFMMIVLTIVFSNIMSRVEFYSVFLFSALLPWQYFQGTVNESLGAIRSNMRLIEQVPIPKFIFLVSIAVSHLVNFFLSLVPLVAVMIVVGHPVPWTFVLFPILLFPLVIITLSFSLLFAVLNVFYEDIKHLTKVGLSALYYLTPILYGPEHLPDHLVRWLKLNPLFHLVHYFRAIFYHGELPNPVTYCLTVVAGFILLAFSLWLFRKTEDKFIYFM